MLRCFRFLYGLTLTFADADNIVSRSEGVCVCVYMVGFLWPACVRCCFYRSTEFSQRKEAVKRGEGERKHSSLSHLSPVCLWFRMCTWMNASCVPVASLNRFVSQVPVANWHPPSYTPLPSYSLAVCLLCRQSCQSVAVTVNLNCSATAAKSKLFPFPFAAQQPWSHIHLFTYTHTHTIECVCVYSHYSYALTWHKKFNGQLMKPPSDSWDVDWLLLLFFSWLLAE